MAYSNSPIMWSDRYDVYGNLSWTAPSWNPTVGGRVHVSLLLTDNPEVYRVVVNTIDPWNISHTWDMNHLLSGEGYRPADFIDNTIEYSRSGTHWKITLTELVFDEDERYFYCTFTVELYTADPGYPPSISIPNRCRQMPDNVPLGGWFLGWAYLEVDSWVSTSSPVSIRGTIRLPWQSSGGIIQTFVNNTTYTFNNGTTEHYTIKLLLTYFTGQPTLQYLDGVYECWYVNAGPTATDAYVCPHGSDSNAGNSFLNSGGFRTIDKGNSVLASGGTLHIQEGFYPSETYIRPLRNVNWKLYNYNQATLPAKMLVSKQNFVLQDYQSAHKDYGYTLNNTTVIDIANTISAMKVHFFRIQSYTETSLEGKSVRLKIFRISGSTFVYVGQSKAVTLKAADYEVDNKWFHDWIPVGNSADDYIQTQSGDIVGLYISSSGFVNANSDSSSNRIYIYSGNITSNVAMSSGSRANNSGMGITLYGIS